MAPRKILEGYNPELIIKQPGFSRHCLFHSPLMSTDSTTQITVPKHIDPQNFREQFKHLKSTQNGFVRSWFLIIFTLELAILKHNPSAGERHINF